MAKKVQKTTKKTAVKKAVKKKKAGKVAKKSVTKKKAAKKTVKNTKTKKTAKKKKTTKKMAVSKKKTSNRKTVRRKRKSTLTAKELRHYRELLIERLKEILGSVNHIESEALKTSRQDSAGDLSSMPIHMADIGSDNYEQEFALGLMDSERKIVQEIYEALKRIQDRTYGICEGTGEPIPKKRLDGIPWARYCVQYAEMVEKGLAFESEGAYEEEFEDINDEADTDIEEDNEDQDDEDDNDIDVFFYGYDDDDDDEEELR